VPGIVVEELARTREADAAALGGLEARLRLEP